MTLEIDLLWALRAAILQGKLEWREREIYICIYLFTYSFIFDICKYYIYIYYIYYAPPTL